MASIIKLLVLVLLCDGIFLFAIKDLFSKQIYNIQGSAIQPNMLGVILSYGFIILLLYWFIIKDSRSLTDAFILGLATYGVYEYTNLALLKNWRLETTIIDTLWGGILFLLVTYLYRI